ncbi:DUF1579 family protein [Pelagicoccus mobilis]|uniref:DUF1579 family protein n=1 Tax=Pelagicoccus mobilis TaxID=415221 RepID=A0A934RV20_9BACT|nr:DUF1579 family protein [Pelagicoccus mobilis]MBK1878185.1 DUF1579 family protein [Pelagicoccus mobilis]
MMRPNILLLAALLATSVSQSQDANPNALDFWIGEWEVSWTDQEGKTHQASNSVKRILNGKVILEEFDASDTLGFTGKSHSVLDGLTGKWKQTWVDSNGSYMDFVGTQEGNTFTFSRSYINKEGENVETRMIFREIKSDSLIWDWQGRKDPTGEWNLLWQLHYKRK